MEVPGSLPSQWPTITWSARSSTANVVREAEAPWTPVNSSTWPLTV